MLVSWGFVCKILLADHLHVVLKPHFFFKLGLKVSLGLGVGLLGIALDSTALRTQVYMMYLKPQNTLGTLYSCKIFYSFKTLAVWFKPFQCKRPAQTDTFRLVRGTKSGTTSSTLSFIKLESNSWVHYFWERFIFFSRALRRAVNCLFFGSSLYFRCCVTYCDSI